MNRYEDRRQAGRVLGEVLTQRGYARRNDVTVLGLPRGGVPVAYEVARRLGAPLDVLVVRKLGVPSHEELAMGAIASGGVQVLNQDLVKVLAIPAQTIERVVALEQQELERRERAYRGARPPLDVRGKTVIVVDDGLATGSTMRAAVAGLRQRGPAGVVVAVPVASADSCAEVAAEADDVICAATPEPFLAVGLWYSDFAQTPDEEVRQLLAAVGESGSPEGASGPGPREFLFGRAASRTGA